MRGFLRSWVCPAALNSQMTGGNYLGAQDGLAGQKATSFAALEESWIDAAALLQSSISEFM